MLGPVFNTIYPWNKTDEPPLLIFPMPKTIQEAQGDPGGSWFWGKCKPVRLEKQPKSMLYHSGFAPTGPWGSKPVNSNIREELFNAIDWSDDEYTRFQWCPTDMLSAWEENERRHKLESERRQQAIQKGDWKVGTDPRHNWQEVKFQRDWGFRSRYTPDEMLYTVNSYGFRADCFEKTKKSAKKKIMFLGCSFTHGVGVRDNENFASIISKDLDAVNWNMGVGGSSPKLAVMYAEHMFRIGYIPNIVCVNWPIIARNVLASKTKFERMLDVPTNHILDDDSLQERKDEWNTIAESDNYSDLGWITTDEGLKLPDISPQVQKVDEFPNHTWNYHPQDINAPFDITGKHINTLLNTLKNTDAFQGQMRLNGTEQELLDFNHLRTKLVYMCKAHGVKLYETFYDASAHRLALDLYKSEPDWRSGVPFHSGSLRLDFARDGSHWGPKSHRVLANHFLDLINNDPGKIGHHG